VNELKKPFNGSNRERLARDELLGVRPGVPASKIIATIVQRIRKQPSFVQFGQDQQTLQDNLATLNAVSCPTRFES
jgi:hypothetical protein